MSLINKVSIVTGADSDIGTALAVKLTREGSRVVVVGTNKTCLENVLEQCVALPNGIKQHAMVADLTIEDEVKKVIDATITAYGKLDILINARTAILSSKSITDEGTLADFDKTMRDILRSVVNTIHLASKYLIKTRGNIVNISYVFSSVDGVDAYFCALNTALYHFSRCIGAELAEKGVRVNTVNRKFDINMPCVMEIQLDSSGQSLSIKNKEVEEIANLITYLVSNKTMDITISAELKSIAINGTE